MASAACRKQNRCRGVSKGAHNQFGFAQDSQRTHLVPDHDVLFVILEDFGQDRKRARVLELAQAISEFVSEEGRLAVKACACGSAPFKYEHGPGYELCANLWR